MEASKGPGIGTDCAEKVMRQFAGYGAEDHAETRIRVSLLIEELNEDPSFLVSSYASDRRVSFPVPELKMLLARIHITFLPCGLGGLLPAASGFRSMYHRCANLSAMWRFGFR